MSKLAENMRHFRMAQGMTQKDLAKKLSVSDSSISNYEKGINEPSNGMVIKLAELFQVSTDALYGRTTRIQTKPHNSSNKRAIKKIRYRSVQDTFLPVSVWIILFATVTSVTVFYFNHLLLSTEFMVSWVLLFVFSVSSIISGKSSAFNELTMDVSDKAYYERDNTSASKNTFTFILINIKFIVSVLATLFAYTLLETILDQNLTALLGFAMIAIMVLYTAIFMIVFRYLLNPKRLDVQRIPDHFHTWLFRVMYGFDSLIVFSSAFMFISNITLFDYNVPDLLVTPLIFVSNLLLAHYVCTHVIMEFSGFSVITVSDK